MTAGVTDPAQQLGPSHVAVSVLVPVLDEEAHVHRTVEAMRAQQFDGALEFLFADGRSADRTREILEGLAREDPRIRVFDNPSGRTPSGLNVCLRHARGDYVARMDAHTVYPPDYLARGVARLQKGGTEWVSGPQVPTPAGRVSTAVALGLSTWLGQGGSRKWGDGAGEGEEYELDTGVFTGVWRRSLVLETRGWDERWPQNQDSEMAARFLARGERLVCLPQMAARYVPRDTLRGLFSQYRSYGYYRARTARRHPRSLRRSHLLAPSLVVTAGASAVAPHVIRRPARLGLLAYVGVLGATTASRAGRAGRAEVATMPLALMAMHLGHGVGFLRGMAAFGPPWAAFAQIAGRQQLAATLAPPDEPVHSPSLAGDASSP